MLSKKFKEDALAQNNINLVSVKMRKERNKNFSNPRLKVVGMCVAQATHIPLLNSLSSTRTTLSKKIGTSGCASESRTLRLTVKQFWEVGTVL